jgi:diguanylate cyclase (GGDEF)-like protein
MEEKRALSIIREILEKAREKLSLEEILSFVLQTVQDEFCPQSSGIMLLDEKTKGLKVVISRGLSGDQIKRIHAKGSLPVLGEIIRRAQPHLIEAGHPHYGKEDYYVEHPHKSFLGVPIKIYGEPKGMAFMDSKEDRAFKQSSVSAFIDIMNLTSLIIENELLNDQVSQMADFDGLTRLYSYKYFHEQLFREIQRTDVTKKSLSLFIVDIDHFKEYNAMYGHVKGDRLLMDVAQMLKKKIRRFDVACRYSGRQFIVVLPETDTAEAKKTAEDVRQEVARLPFEGKDLKITASIGLVTYPQHAGNERDLLSLAEQQIQESRRAGGDKVVNPK